MRCRRATSWRWPAWPGIQAAKRAPDLIPLCHPLLVGSVFVNFRIEDHYIEVETQVDTVDRTGVEMEALTACSIACLTIYDMCKSADRSHGHRRRHAVGEDGGPFGHLPPPARSRRRARLTRVLVDADSGPIARGRLARGRSS